MIEGFKCDHAYGQFAEIIDYIITRHPQAEIIARKLVVNAPANCKLNPANDCPDLIDTSPVLDDLTNTKSNCVACDLPFMSPFKKKKKKETAWLDIDPTGTECLTCLCVFKFFWKLDL